MITVEYLDSLDTIDEAMEADRLVFDSSVCADCQTPVGGFLAYDDTTGGDRSAIRECVIFTVSNASPLVLCRDCADGMALLDRLIAGGHAEVHGL